MARFTSLFMVFICGIAAASLIYYWPEIQSKFLSTAAYREQETADLQKAEKLLRVSQSTTALSLIKKYTQEIERHSATGRKWLSLFIQAATDIPHPTQLAALYQWSPKAFEHNEKASLIVARYFINSHNGLDYQKLRQQWKGRESQPNAWLTLDTDKLLLDGKSQEAIDMLKSKTVSENTSEESNRLVKLALLSVADNPKIAWDYLSQAIKNDQKNSDLFTYRAKILEGIDNRPLAELEFISAANAAPSNPFLKDQLAEFYIRHKQYPPALQAWEEALKLSPPDFIWIKPFFWNRVITPLTFDWKNAPAQGNMKPYTDYLAALPQGKFWDHESFNRLPDSASYLNHSQSTFWLRLLKALKIRDEQAAWNLLQDNLFHKMSWNPYLERALKRILIYRKIGTLNSEDPAVQTVASITLSKKDAFFDQLEEVAKTTLTDNQVPQDLHALLTSDEAFAAAFLAAGWWEAALQLHIIPVFPAEFPQWVAYELTQALRVNRSDSQALQFAKKQNPTSELNLLIGELFLASNQPKAAIEQLNKISTEQSEWGNSSRSAHQLSLH